MSRYFNEGFDAMGGDALEHANKPHKYIKKVKTKSGKTRYVYKAIKAGSRFRDRINGIAAEIPHGEAYARLGAAYDGRSETIGKVGNAGRKIAKSSRTLQQVRTPHKSSTLGAVGKVPEFGVTYDGRGATIRSAGHAGHKVAIVGNAGHKGAKVLTAAAKGIAKKNTMGTAKVKKKKKK
jgi:hypothetical protein